MTAPGSSSTPSGNACPAWPIRTTFIAGYPGETASEFRELKEFVEKSRFERVGVFAYSEEEGTSAARIKDSVSATLKEERARELMELQEEHLAEDQYSQDQCGNENPDRQKEGAFYIGRTEFDSPEVDNEVLIPKDTISSFPDVFIRYESVGPDHMTFMPNNINFVQNIQNDENTASPHS